MTTELDRATALTATGPGRFSVTVDPAWFVQTGPNGGYVAALLMRGLETIVNDPARPARAMTIHYLKPAVEGPAELEVDVLRAGRSLSFLAVRLLQGGALLATGLASFGVGRAELAFQVERPPGDLPHADTLPAPQRPPLLTPPIAERLDYRPVEPAELFSGAPPEFWCWLRLRDPRPLDAAVLALYVDAMIPTLFLRATTPVVVPTLDLTVHLRATPPPDYTGWCLAHVRTRTVAEGFAEEDCDIYDESGTLLAQSRQLGLVVPLA